MEGGHRIPQCLKTKMTNPDRVIDNVLIFFAKRSGTEVLGRRARRARRWDFSWLGIILDKYYKILWSWNWKSLASNCFLLMSIVCLDWPFLLQRLHLLTAGKWTRFPLGLRLLNMLDNLPSKNWQEWADGEEGADVHRCFHNVASIYANISFWWHHSCMFWCINRGKNQTSTPMDSMAVSRLSLIPIWTNILITSNYWHICLRLFNHEGQFAVFECFWGSESDRESAASAGGPNKNSPR